MAPDKNAPVVGIPYSNVQMAQQQGYHFPEEDELERYNKDNDADPNRPRDFLENFGEGAAHTAKSHVAGLVSLWAKMNNAADPSDVLDFKKTHPGATDQQAIDAVDGKDLESQIRGTPYRSGVKKLEQAQLKDAAAHLRENTELHGAGGWLGAAGENLVEYLGLDGLLKLAEVPEVAAGAEGLSMAQKTAAAAKTAKVLEENPKIAKLTAEGLKSVAAKAAQTGVRTGAVSGAQTYLDTGGDADAAAKSAAWGAVPGAVLEGGLGAVGLAREAYAAKSGAATQSLKDYQDAMAAYRQQVAERATKTDVQNADWQAAKEAQNADHAAAMEAYNQALTERATQMEQARTAWKASIDQQKAAHDAAMEAYRKAVDEQNAAHQEAVTARTTANQKALSEWKSQLDAQAQKHAADLADYQQQLDSHTQMVASLKNEAATALKTQRQIEAQAGITNIAKNAAQDAITRMNEARGTVNFEPVDPVEASKGVTTFGDTAEAVRDAARPVYDAINEATEGKFSDLQQARSRAMRANDFGEVEKVEGKIDQMLNQNPGVKPEEWRAAKSAWRDSKDLDRIHNAVEGAFSVPQEMVGKTGVDARELAGSKMQARLNSILRGAKKMDPARISELIGPDGLEGLYRAAKMTSTPELRAATNDLAQKVAAELPPPTAPVKPAPIAKPELQPKPVAPAKPPVPVRGVLPSAPEPLPKPNAPVRPLAPAKPAPLPRPTLPAKPTNLPTRPLAYGEIGKNTVVGAAGGLIGPHVGLTATQGAEAALMTRYVLRQMITNPAVGKMAEYAVDYGATPERAAKLIAAMIAKSQTEQSQAVQP
jgi:hypothetical protein